MTFVLDVIADPPATGVAETVKPVGGAPQFVQPTVKVAEVSATVRAEIVAIGFGVVTVVETVALVWPLKVTEARIVCATFGDRPVKFSVVMAELAAPEIVLGEPPEGVIDAT
jgi:hypothetical protein